MNTAELTYTTQEQQALAIFERHVAAFTAGNLDAVMNDFGPQSLVITGDGVYEGLEQIRTLYGGLLAEFGNIARGDSPGLSVDALHVRRDMIFIAWHAESLHNFFPYGTDTFICEGDKFARQSIAYSTPRPRDGSRA